MNALDTKINDRFAGLVVRKDLVGLVKGNAIVPSYVLEYLLGQYCATHDEGSIISGVETVKQILAAHYVHRNEAGLVRSRIRERGRYKVIDRIGVDLNEKRDVYEATFASLGIKQVLVNADTIKRHPKLLVGGVWCIAEVEYLYSEQPNTSPWLLASLKPIQLSSFNMEQYLATRRQFSTEEWIDLLMQSIGFDPAFFSRRGKLLQLLRLVPFCERNYNLIELGPKGTGKSHVYSEFSPHGILISGGEVTAAKLFVNNATGRIGLVGYWDVVAFDEFAGKQKNADKALVDILKNYMANKSFSRGIETLGADASLVFVGNTSHDLAHMLRHADLFDDLPPKYYDSAFLDRLHFYLPGWEVDIIRSEMFSDGYGFVVDYLAEILRNLRTLDYSQLHASRFELLSDLSTRDRTSILKTFSGMMKVLYPHQEATTQEMEELLRFAIEGRKRVKDQLLRIDSTYADVRFGYTDHEQRVRLVKTLEELEYPEIGEPPPLLTPADLEEAVGTSVPPSTPAPSPAAEGLIPEPQHLVFADGQRGVSYDRLFGPYLQDARLITVTDPYIRQFYQARNLMEFLETVARFRPKEAAVEVRLITEQDEFNDQSQLEYLGRIEEAAGAVGIAFSWLFDESGSLHARSIVTDTGWKISLDRGLDIFQRYEMNNAFDFANRLQEYRACKAFEVTWLQTGESADSASRTTTRFAERNR